MPKPRERNPSLRGLPRCHGEGPRLALFCVNAGFLHRLAAPLRLACGYPPPPPPFWTSNVSCFTYNLIQVYKPCHPDQA